MVFFNHATRQMTAKIVYYGPGLCGKTTNLNTIYGKTSTKARGEMVSLNTETDRTLFFDLLPMDVGMVGGFKTKLQLYTVPGQVFYNSTRKLVLKGVDGIVFVVDSQIPMLDASKESLQNLEENLRELGLKLGEIPMVFQWNKRDLKNVVPVDQLEKDLNPAALPSFQACAQDGTGVFETLRGITKLSLQHIKTNVLGDTSAPKESPARPAPAPEPAPKAAIAPAPPPPPPVPSAPGATPAQALTLSDLPTFSSLLEDTGVSKPGLPAPAPPPPPPPPPAPLPDEDKTEVPLVVDSGSITKPISQEEVQRALAGVPPPPKPPPPPPAPHAAHPTGPVVPKFSIPASTFGAPKPTGKGPNPKDAINSLLGDLTMVGKLGAPSVIRVELPAEAEGEIEVVVQVKQSGELIGTSTLKRNVPNKGVPAKLTLEIKRG
jgi:small GTP-binding protein